MRARVVRDHEGVVPVDLDVAPHVRDGTLREGKLPQIDRVAGVAQVDECRPVRAPHDGVLAPRLRIRPPPEVVRDHAALAAQVVDRHEGDEVDFAAGEAARFTLLALPLLAAHCLQIRCFVDDRALRLPPVGRAAEDESRALEEVGAGCTHHRDIPSDRDRHAVEVEGAAGSEVGDLRPLARLIPAKREATADPATDQGGSRDQIVTGGGDRHAETGEGSGGFGQDSVRERPVAGSLCSRTDLTGPGEVVHGAGALPAQGSSREDFASRHRHAGSQRRGSGIGGIETACRGPGAGLSVEDVHRTGLEVGLTGPGNQRDPPARGTDGQKVSLDVQGRAESGPVRQVPGP